MRQQVAQLADSAAVPPPHVVQLQSQIGNIEQQQTVVQQKLEQQTDAMTQLQQQLLRVEQLCIKLSNNLSAAAAAEVKPH
jgi:hypothetical protein